MENLTIKNILQKDIERKINGVVKADSNEKDTIITELNEYVVTEEIRKRLIKFFDKYVDSINSPTEDMGVWISGFFGSGKSHFLKMIGHILENNTYDGKKVVDFFKEKIDDAILMGNIEKAAEIPTDVILFNIDNVSDQDTHQNKDSIALAFLKKFNEYLGFTRDDIEIAEFERKLWEDGKLEEFKKVFEEESGKTWKDANRNLDFHSDDFIDVVEKLEIMNRESAERWLERDIVRSINAESFRDLLENYLKMKDPKHRIVFLVDEIGQYIGDNSKLMLNLQTLVETLGVKFKGRVWVGVTSQQDLGSILNNSEHRKNDFSKIQDRFKTILSLSSGNIDEVIKKRLLIKKKIEGEDLEKLFDKNRVEIENLINFETQMTLPLYDSAEDFSETYPFVAYQFNLLQKVFEKVRNMGHSGQHMSRGERSLLSSFQEAGIKVKDKNIRILVPFNYFYESIEQFLEDNVRRPFIHARNEKKVDDFGLEVLKLLFLLKGINGINPTLNNLTSFMIDSIDCDRIELEKKIKKALEKLEKEVLIQKDGDNYYFLTNEEQDINREIEREDIDFKKIDEKIDSYIFKEIFTKSSIIMEDTGNKYGFSRTLDETAFSKAGEELAITIFTERADDYDNVSIVGTRPESDLIIRLPNDDETYRNEIKLFLKVESYIRNKQKDNERESIIRILEIKQRENNIRDKRIKNELERIIGEAEVFIYGQKQDIKTKDAAKKIEESLKALANHRFHKAKLVKKPYDEAEIRKTLSYVFDTNKNGILFDIKKSVEANENREAINEVLERIKSLEKRGDTPITLKNISDYYLRTPYGWGQLTINGLVGELWKYRLINLEESKVLVTDENIATNLLTKLQNKNLEKIVISLREELDPELVKKVNNLLKEIKTLKEETGEVTIDSPKEDLLEILNRKIGIAKRYKIECEHSKYPGKKELSDWIELLEEIILSRDNAEKTLKNFLEMKDEISKEYYKVDRVFDFFTSSKKDRYDEVIQKINKIEEYKDYIGSLKETPAYKTIEEIRNDKNIYERIREFDELITELDKEKDKLIELEKESLRAKVEKYREDFSEKLKDNTEILKKLEEKFNNFLENEVNNSDSSNDMAIFMKSKKLENIVSKFEDEYKNYARKEIEKLESYLNEVAEDKTDIDKLRQSIKSTYNNYKNEIAKSDIRNISSTITKAIKDKDDFYAELNGKAKKKERVILRKVSISSKTNIETEDQVNEYISRIEKDIEKLKNEMLEAIRNNKIIDIG
ncbi:BREX system P-loop protein BrxC [Fusobacterium pseudoperiodonticum]|uniref:ATP--cob(I)alamin adenosyltransferase n=1 Tax=Fusobacterium pseudoperiodonticum TaxID=2663009 RepID=A0A2D3NSU3_9FUSO|nr:BREX system P-loop protein BrxC [Fusobacterium pseudoperiodonticum]ATV58457.1 ATP--cob(I)alamin adenosyltransferase [Fusobacterium pseudoperiodonticum]